MTATSFYASPSTIFTDSGTLAMSALERVQSFFPKRLLSAAQSWSHAATEPTPAESTDTTMGGRGLLKKNQGHAKKGSTHKEVSALLRNEGLVLSAALLNDFFA